MEGINTFPHYVRRPLRNLWRKTRKKSSSSSSWILQSSSSSSGASLPVLTCMGSMYSALGKLEDSMLAHRRSLEILEREYGKNSTSLITPLLGMVIVLGSIRKPTKAVEVYHCVITILELSKGAESEDLVVPLLGLDNLLMKEKLWMLKILLLELSTYMQS